MSAVTAKVGKKVKRGMVNDSNNNDNQSSDDTDNGTGGCGCIGPILLVLIVWGLLFGVTVDGKHYGLAGCDTEHGVKIDK